MKLIIRKKATLILELLTISTYPRIKKEGNYESLV